MNPFPVGQSVVYQGPSPFLNGHTGVVRGIEGEWVEVEMAGSTWHIHPERLTILTDGREPQAPTGNAVEHPTHYTSHPSGVECIDITQHMNFCRGNAIKYLWRAGAKGNEIEDLRKARQYIDIEIKRMENTRSA